MLPMPGSGRTSRVWGTSPSPFCQSGSRLVVAPLPAGWLLGGGLHWLWAGRWLVVPWLGGVPASMMARAFGCGSVSASEMASPQIEHGSPARTLCAIRLRSAS